MQSISLVIVRIKYFNGWKILRMMFEMHCILIVMPNIRQCTLVIVLPFSLINSSLIKIIEHYHVRLIKQDY